MAIDEGIRGKTISPVEGEVGRKSRIEKCYQGNYRKVGKVKQEGLKAGVKIHQQL